MNIARFLGIRLLLTALTLVSATTLIYRVTTLAPSSQLPTESAAPQLSYMQWLFGDGADYRGVVGGDYGQSFVTRRAAYESVMERLPATLELWILALAASLILGIIGGVVMALLRRWLTDGFLRPLAWLGASTPIFWLALMLILVFAIPDRSFPLGGRCSVSISDGCPPFYERMEYLTLPLMALYLVWGSVVALAVRQGILRRAASDPNRNLTGGHVVQGMLLAVVGSLPALLAGLFGSLLLVETIFAWPGAARLTVNAAFQRDYPVLVAVTTLVTVWMIVIYLVCSLLYALLAYAFGQARPDGQPEPAQTTPGFGLAPEGDPASARPVIDRIYTVIAGIAALFLVGIFVLSLAPSLVTSANPLQTNPRDRLMPANSENHPWGTDELGRDIQARALEGGRTTLTFALNASLIALVIGGLVGLVVGLLGEGIGDLVYFPFNLLAFTLAVFPLLLLLVYVSAMLAANIDVISLILGVVGATLVAPVFRAKVRYVRSRGWRGTLLGWLALPIYALALVMGVAIVAEISLSFLGLGVTPPTPSWGSMLSNAQQYLVNSPYLVVIPGLLIVATCFCLHIVAARLHDTFDFLPADSSTTI